MWGKKKKTTTPPQTKVCFKDLGEPNSKLGLSDLWLLKWSLLTLGSNKVFGASKYGTKSRHGWVTCAADHLILLGLRFMEEKSSNNSRYYPQVPVSDGIVFYPWKSMQFCFLGNREVLGSAGFRSLNMGLLYLTLPVLLLLGAACLLKASLGCSRPRVPLDQCESVKFIHPP